MLDLILVLCRGDYTVESKPSRILQWLVVITVSNCSWTL